MYDVVGKIWAYLLAIMFFFYATLTVFAQRHDAVVQQLVETSAEEFIDIARTNGYIAKSEYNTLITKLDSTGNVYEVRIDHYSKKANTLESDENYQESFEVFDKKDILLAMQNSDPAYGSEKYMMRKGDFIRIEIRNINPTISRRLIGMVMGNVGGGGQIQCSYGGYIGYDN